MKYSWLSTGFFLLSAYFWLCAAKVKIGPNRFWCIPDSERDRLNTFRLADFIIILPWKRIVPKHEYETLKHASIFNVAAAVAAAIGAMFSALAE